MKFVPELFNKILLYKFMLKNVTAFTYIKNIFQTFSWVFTVKKKFCISNIFFYYVLLLHKRNIFVTNEPIYY